MLHEAENPETGMELRDLLLDREFSSRRLRSLGPGQHFEALRRLTHALAERPDTMLQELVNIAVEFCGADSAGISLEENDSTGELRFRWVAIAGSFAQYMNATTPRFFSPCGTCLSSGRAQLYRVTKPYYDFLGVEAEPITDGILIPWTAVDQRGTIWAVAHHSSEAFAPDDYELLNCLADFVSIGIRHQFRETTLRQKEKEIASATRANELAHQINNPLQSLTNVVYLARQGGNETQQYLQQASKELIALSEVVRKSLKLRTEFTADELQSSRE